MQNEAVVAAAAAAFSGPPRTEDFLAGNGGACEPSGPHPMVGPPSSAILGGLALSLDG